MCPIQFPSIPPETVQAVGAVFGQSNLAVAIADQSPHLFSDLEIVHRQKSPNSALSLFYRPAVVTVFQFIEKLPDRRAAEATRTRIEWKYALRLPLNHPGIEHSALCEFRRLLLLDAECRAAFEEMLARVESLAPVSGKNGSVWNADEMLGTVCDLSRLELLMLRIHQVLDVMATYQPERLREAALLSPYARYGRRLTRPLPSSPQAQEDLIREIGTDICYVLQAMENFTEQDPLALPELQALYQACSQNFVLGPGQAHWRSQGCVACTHA